jgi:hypothetical protein
MGDRQKIIDMDLADLKEKVAEHSRITISIVIRRWVPLVGSIFVFFMGAIWYLLSSNLNMIVSEQQASRQVRQELIKAINNLSLQLNKHIGTTEQKIKYTDQKIKDHDKRIGKLEKKVFE